MIAEVKFGGGARGLVKYILSEPKPGLVDYITGDQHELGSIAFRNLASANARDAAREMETLASLSKRVKKPYMHLILSWHPSERPTEEEMIGAMDALLKCLGLDDHQAVLAVHREKHHLHVHAGVNRIGPDGIAWDTWRCKQRIMKHVRALEVELNFQPHATFAKGPRVVPLTAQEQRVLEASGSAPELPADIVRAQRMERADRIMEKYGARARTIIKKATTWDEALAQLEAIAIGVEEYHNPKTPLRRGLMLVDLETGERCAISELGSDYGRAKLEKRFGAFPERPKVEIAEQSIEEARAVAAGIGLTVADTEYRPYTPDRTLRDEYDAQRRATIDQRTKMVRELRRLEREERAELFLRRSEQAAMLNAKGLSGPMLRAAQSELAFEHAQKLADLDDAFFVRREEMRASSPLPIWTEYLAMRAKQGEQPAITELWRMSRHRGPKEQIDPFDPLLSQPEEQVPTPPTARAIKDLRYDVDGKTGNVHYVWTSDQRDAFADLGDRVRIYHSDQEREDLRVALRFAAAKWGNRIFADGSIEFREAAVREAAELGITILNPRVEIRPDVRPHVPDGPGARRATESPL